MSGDVSRSELSDEALEEIESEVRAQAAARRAAAAADRAERLEAVADLDDELNDEAGDPNVLGAASTLPAQKSKGPSRQQRKTDRQNSKLSSERASAVDPDEVVYVFEPHAATRPNVIAYVRALLQRRKFITELAKSDIRGRRSSTALGSLWGVLDPVFQSAIYFFLYMVIRGNGGEATATKPADFLPALIGGVFLFNLSSQALNEGGRSVRTSTSLMLNSSFPRALLPISKVYKGLLNFAPTAVIFAILYAFVGAPPQRGLLILPVLFAIQIILNTGIALFMSTVVVFFEDVGNLLRYIQRILFFTTPIIFPASLIAVFEPWVALQPFYALFSSYQEVLLGGTADLQQVLVATGWALGTFVLGAWLFLRYERAMAARL